MEESNNEAVQCFFNKHSESYSRHFADKHSGGSLGFRQRLALAVEMTGAVSGILLDCACGPGEISSAILESGRFKSATLVDLSPQMLAMARKRLDDTSKNVPPVRLEYVASDIFEFLAKPAAEKYDLVLCLGLIAHTGRLDELLQRLKAILAPNGRILLQSTLLDHLGTRMTRALSSGRYYRRCGYRISYFSHSGILKSASGAGLTIDAMRRFSVGFPFGGRLWAWGNYQMERRLAGWAATHGAEALYLLKNKGDGQ